MLIIPYLEIVSRSGIIRRIKNAIAKLGLVRSVFIFLVIVLTMVFVFRDEIKESKYTKAKLEMFNRMKDNSPEEWPSEISNVFDSLILEKKDTVIVKE